MRRGVQARTTARRLLGLGYFDDVDPDDALPVPRSEIVDYWTRRQREIITARGRLSA